MHCPLQVFNFSIKNAGEDAVDIHIDGDIVDASTQAILKAWLGDDTSISFKSFRDQVNATNAKTYNVYINSPGGIVTDAMAIHDFLAELEEKGKTVNRIGRGIVASAATYLLMGKNSSMTKNSWFMIHNVSGAVWGDVDTVENYAATLRKFNNRSRDFYAEETGQRKEEITKWMNSETWMTADEALAKGFIKSVIGAEKFTKQIARDNWQYSNMAILNTYNNDVEPKVTENIKMEDMKKLFSEWGAAIMSAIKGVKEPENKDHATLMASIGEAVQGTFEQQAAVFEQAMNDTIAAATPKGGITQAELDTAIEAVKPTAPGLTQEQLNAAIQAAIKPIQDELVVMKGNKSNPKKEDDEITQPVGKWN